MRSSTPGPKFSTSTSQLLIRAVRTSLPFGFLVSSVIEGLLWLSMVKYRLSTFGTSCNWPRVISPTPGRSTLITSAPNHASNCVQVGPDWTCVKSRMRTPLSAFVIVLLRLVSAPAPAGRKRGGAARGPAPDVANLFLAKHALRVEVADAAALRAGSRVDHHVDQGRVAGLDRSGDRKAHADAHDAPGADVQALARLVHVDDAAREIERIGAFVDEDRVRPLLGDGPQCTERAVVIHRRFIVHQPRRHLGDVFFALRIDGADPVSRRGGPVAAHRFEQCGHAGTDVADHGCCNLDI